MKNLRCNYPCPHVQYSPGPGTFRRFFQALRLADLRSPPLHKDLKSVNPKSCEGIQTARKRRTGNCGIPCSVSQGWNLLQRPPGNSNSCQKTPGSSNFHWDRRGGGERDRKMGPGSIFSTFCRRPRSGMAAAAAAAAAAGCGAAKIMLPSSYAIVAARTFTSVPIIDIKPLMEAPHEIRNSGPPETLEVVRQIDEACRDVGFFYVKGHGVPQDLINSVREASRQFFNLPSAEKCQIRMNKSTGGRGYQILKENVTLGVPDLHEAIDFYRELDGKLSANFGDTLAGLNQWPQAPQLFQPLVRQYLQSLLGVGKTIMQGIGVALDGSPEAFEGKRAGDPFWVLRVIGYPAIPNQTDDDVGCGEHTDYGLLTLVNQDPDISALQVKNRDGEWIWVDPIPETFVVNIGDMLEIWTNGMYQPTVHRVLNSESTYRVSLPFFYEPNFDAIVEPLEACKERTGGRSKFDAVCYGDHVTSKVETNFG